MVGVVLDTVATVVTVADVVRSLLVVVVVRSTSQCQFRFLSTLTTINTTAGVTGTMAGTMDTITMDGITVVVDTATVTTAQTTVAAVVRMDSINSFQSTFRTKYLKN